MKMKNNSLAIIFSLLVILGSGYAILPPCEIFMEIDGGVINNRFILAHKGENISFKVRVGICELPFNITIENNCVSPKRIQVLELSKDHYQYKLSFGISNSMKYFNTCDVSVIEHPKNVITEKLSFQIVPYKIKFIPEEIEIGNLSKENKTLTIINYEDFPIKIRFNNDSPFVTGSWKVNNEGEYERLSEITPCPIKLFNRSFEIKPGQSLNIMMEIENKNEEPIRCYLQPFTVEGPKGTIKYPLNYYSFTLVPISYYEQLNKEREEREIARMFHRFVSQFVLIVIFIVILIWLFMANKSSKK